MKKRWLAGLLSFIMVLEVLPVWAAAEEPKPEPVFTVSEWTWADEAGELQDGGLSVTGVSAENPAAWETVEKRLPTQIQATVEGAEGTVPLALNAWTKPEGYAPALPGAYTAETSLADGMYVLGKDTAALRIEVTLKAADSGNVLQRQAVPDISTLADTTVAGLTVTPSDGGQVSVNNDYTAGKIVLDTNGTYTISGTWADSYVGLNSNKLNPVICVKKGVTATVILKNVTIDLTGRWWVSPFHIEPGANVTLQLEGTNTLTAADCCAGLSVPKGASLRIKHSTSGGKLTVNGGNSGGAGIGGSNKDTEFNDAGVILIENPTQVIAQGGKYAAGNIGAGNDSSIVTYAFADNGDLTKWTVGADLTMSGTAEVPTGVTLTVPQKRKFTVGTDATLTNNGTINTQGNFTNNGTINNIGSINNTGTFVDNGTITGNFVSGIKTAVALDATGGSVTPTTVYVDIHGTYTGLPTATRQYYVFEGWFSEYNGGTKVDDTTNYNQAWKTLYAHWSDEPGGEPVTSATTVLKNDKYIAEGTVTIDQRIEVEGSARLLLKDGCKLTIQKGIRVAQGTSLTITGGSGVEGTGELIVKGNGYGAGIGGNRDESAGTIIINGGIVTSYGDGLNAAIGGGYHSESGGTITITGGIVRADNGERPAGIGGGDGDVYQQGHWGNSGNITIDGNVFITASGAGKDGGGIGAGWYGDTNTVTFRKGLILRKFNNKAETGSGKVYGKATIPGNIEIPAEYTVEISEGDSLTIPAGNDFVNYGTIQNGGTVTNNGRIINVWPGKFTDNAAIKGTGKIEAAILVQFNANGGKGTVPENIVALVGQRYGAYKPFPQENDFKFNKTGYTFSGWYTEKSNGEQVTAASTVTKTDTQPLYAHWTANSYTVTFDYQEADGGNETTEKTVIFDSPYGELPSPTKVGFNFAGWYTETMDGSQVTSTTTVKTPNNHTLYARWTPKTAITINETPQEKTYNGLNQAFTVTPTPNGVSGFKVEYFVNNGWTETAPVGAGTYHVKITRAEDDTYAAFSKEISDGLVIQKANLTVTAKGKTITYGDAPAAGGVTYASFVGSDGASALGGSLEYDIDYTQYGDVGENYTITPKGLTSDNYNISFVAGKLTVQQKEVSLEWQNINNRVFGDGQTVTATVTNAVNGDTIGVTVANGDQTEAGGPYTATANALTGDKAGNYKLLAVATKQYSISKAEQQAPDVKIDYVKETLSTTAAMQYSLTGGEPWETCTKDMAASKFGWDGEKKVTVQFRLIETDNLNAGALVEITIPARSDAPGVEIDYDNETLSTTAAMEYSVNGGNDWADCSATMAATAFDGWNGTETKHVKFRTKAVAGDAGKPASKVQEVEIPKRPDKPQLAINNGKESVQVFADYCYGTAGEAYDQITTPGTGSEVTVKPEGSIYLYKAAVTVGEHKAFKSFVQTITAPARGVTPAVKIDYEKETLSTKTAMEYSLDGGNRWEDCARDTMAAAAFGGWDGLETKQVKFRTKATDGTNGKYASEEQEVVIPKRPEAPKLAIENDKESVQVSADYCYGTAGDAYDQITTPGTGSEVIVKPEGSIYLYKTAVTVGEHKAFKSFVQTITAPARGATPAVEINYTAETLSTDAAMEYRLENDTSWTVCTGENMAAAAFGGWDGTADIKVIFRTKDTDGEYASEEQEVVIPKRPEAPKLAIENGKESVQVSADYCYGTAGEAYDQITTPGTGSEVTVKPEGSIYLYKTAVTVGESKAFKSFVQTITAPARDVTPALKIDYTAETLSTDATMEYRLNNDTNWTACTGGNMAAAAFGNWDGTADIEVIFRTKATGGTNGKYASEEQKVDIPKRPDAPVTPLQLTKTADSITMTNEDAYGGCAFSVDGAHWQDRGAFSGLDAGKTYLVRVRVKATETAFRSESMEQSVTTVNEDGSTSLKPGEKAEIGDTSIRNDGTEIVVEKGENPKTTTTITRPESGDAELGTGGKVNTPANSTVKTDGGPETELPTGGIVDGDGKIGLPAGGTVVTGEEPNKTIITVPPEGTVKPDGKGGLEISDGCHVKTGEDGPEIGLPDGGLVHEDGSVTTGADGRVQIGDTTITPPAGGVLTTDRDGNTKAPAGSKTQTGTGPEITIGPGNDGEVDKDGNVSVAAGGKIQIGEDPRITIILPGGGKVITNTDGSVTVPGGTIVQVGDREPITIPASGGTVTAEGEVRYSVTVTFDSQEGSAVGSQSVTVGRKAVKPADPERSGYTFDGWYKESECVNKWVFETDAVNGNCTLYAKWTPNRSGGGGGSPTGKPTATVDGEGGKIVVEKDGTVTMIPDEGYEIEKITVNGKEVKLPSDGKLKGFGSADKVVVRFGRTSGRPEKPKVDLSKFFDLDMNAWYIEAVRYVVENGLFYGTSETTFGPDETMTRAMLMTVLARAEGLDTAPPAGGKWYDVGMQWATQNGISDGTNLDGNITREQLATMLWRYAGQPDSAGSLDPFTDAETAGRYAQAALRWAVERGILNGKGNGVLDPKGAATRAEVAAMVMRYLTGA